MKDPILSGSASPTPPPTPARQEIPATPGISTNVVCPSCRMESTIEISNNESTFKCGFCKITIELKSFPRLTHEPKAKETISIAAGGDATCQFYPELKAELVCDECGCFMSDKASVNWGERILCMPCLHNLREQKADTDYRANLKIWDNRALALLAMIPITLFTAPVAFFVLIRYRKEPRGWIPRSSFRWWLAMIFSIIALAGWTALIVVWIAMMAREMQ